MAEQVKSVPQTPEMSKNLPIKEEPKVDDRDRVNREEEHRLKRLHDREEALAKAREILEEYHGEESNIPLTSEYWNLMNVQRGLR